ncbi:MAG: UTP--glucose-1-phosphate uridylyltransferase [Patescibacteria group bacterium]|jgi:UDP-N-acetylglucosamine pyrophosphorylase
MQQIDKAEIQQQLIERGIDPNHIKALHIKIKNGQLNERSFVLEKTSLKAPTSKNIINYNKINTKNNLDHGIKLLQNDNLLVFWLNGGAATRYFNKRKIKPAEATRYAKALAAITPVMTNLPKGITPVVAKLSYLELNIRNLLHITKQYQLPVHPQVVLMNSFITDQPTRNHLQSLFKKYPNLQPNRFHYLVQQPTIPRFQAATELKNIDLFVDTHGELSWAPCGHGDFVYLLQDYLKQNLLAPAKYLFFSNIDNLGATIDPVLLGQHATAQLGRTVELARKEIGDTGGVPCFVNNQLMIVEQMKFPKTFNWSAIPWFNTNTFWFTLKDLLAFKEDLPLVLAEKTISTGTVLQLERFACDVTLPSEYIEVPRTQRFWPIKRYVDALIYQDTNSKTPFYKNFTALLKNSYNISGAS